MKKSIIFILILSIAIISGSSAQLRRMEISDTENKFPKVPLATGKPVISTAPFDSAIKSDEAANSLAKVETKGEFNVAGFQYNDKKYSRVVFRSKYIYIGPGSLTAKAFFILPKPDVFFNAKAYPKVKITILNEKNNSVKDNLFPITMDDILQEGPKEFTLLADNLPAGNYYAQVIFLVECMPGGVFAFGGKTKLDQIKLIPAQ